MLIPYGVALALASLRKPFFEAARWTFRSRELYNFTYDLSDLKKQYRASFIAVVSDHHREYGRVLYGDSVEMLRSVKENVDIFIHDSDHRPEYELREFLVIEKKLVSNAIVLGDNANEADKLLEFARRIGKTFLYFQDQPKNHWWRGDGIGAAFTPGVKTVFGNRREKSA